jgi:hypothetical protein
MPNAVCARRPGLRSPMTGWRTTWPTGTNATGGSPTWSLLQARACHRQLDT